MIDAISLGIILLAIAGHVSVRLSGMRIDIREFCGMLLDVFLFGGLLVMAICRFVR